MENINNVLNKYVNNLSTMEGGILNKYQSIKNNDQVTT